MNPQPNETLPTRWQAAFFQFKAVCFRTQRFLREFGQKRVPRLDRAETLRRGPIVAESRTVLFNSSSPAEFALQAGKVHNLRLAARRLHGLVIPAGETFSFWRNLGRATRSNGFVAGRELREGCVIPNIGGGLCQLSNALHDIALRSGCEIVERHGHSRQVAGSTTAPGRDATVFWNYVDLRFRPALTCQLRVELTRGELTVALDAMDAAPVVAAPAEPVPAPCETRVELAESCETCGVVKCFRNPGATSLPRHGITAWLLDKFEPEFDRWIDENHEEQDAILLPIKSRFVSNYGWKTSRFAHVGQAPWTTLRRSFHSRRLAAQGAERQRALLEFDRALALSFARAIPHLADHVVVSQNLLPFLWQQGDLGGRTFDVLMTRAPIAHLEQVLDVASGLHPECKTLKDFRAPARLRETETEALAAARFWVTPHAQIAALAGERAVKLDWIAGDSTATGPPGDFMVFPASTLGRKGSYELREAVRELGIALHIVGPNLEDPQFWRGLNVQTVGSDWIEAAGIVVLPAWVEHWPRRALRAAAAGRLVIASEACGLAGVAHVAEVRTGDVNSLREALQAGLQRICA